MNSGSSSISFQARASSCGRRGRRACPGGVVPEEPFESGVHQRAFDGVG